MLGNKEKIKSIVYLLPEQSGKRSEDRKAIFDACCRTEDGKIIIVEMQNVPQTHFSDRSLYYSTFAIQQQAKKGNWDYELKAVYIIGILNFKLISKSSLPGENTCIAQVNLVNKQTSELFSDNIEFLLYMRING
jgi:predicted transposase/invertase (TIGR01784 family)